MILPLNATITQSGGTPNYWFYDNGVLYFSLPIGSGGVPFLFTIDSTPVSDDGSCINTLVFFAYSNNQNPFSYTIAPNPVTDILRIVVDDNDGNLGNKLSHESVLVTSENKKIEIKNFQFSIQVYDIINHSLVLSGKSNRGELQGEFDVSSLKPGNYFVRITDEAQTQTIKFIKN